MGGIHIPADGLPRDYELLRGNGVSDASRRHRHSLLGIIFVILNNNIIFGGLCDYNMERSCDYCLKSNLESAVDIIYTNDTTVLTLRFCVECACNGVTLKEIVEDDMEVAYPVGYNY